MTLFNASPILVTLEKNLNVAANIAGGRLQRLCG
jgi:hypothetical protein